jgi:phosphatidylinositol-3-phosphatase
MDAEVSKRSGCEECGSALDAGQRYCLSCGARRGPRSHAMTELIARVRGQRAEQVGVFSARPHARASGLALPSPRVASVLLLAFLGFGIALGAVASSPPANTLTATAARQLRILLPAQSASSSTSTATASLPPSLAATTPTPGPATTSASATDASTAATPNSVGAGAGASSRAGGSSSPGGSGAASGTSSSGNGTSGSGATGDSSGSVLPPIKHVFLIVLANQPYASVFGPSSPARYLSHTLEKRGELLVRYYGVAHDELAGAIALVSGQGPTAQTAANCSTYADITGSTVGANEQVTGQGCVYPASTQTVASELVARHLTWRAYVEGMGAPAKSATCAHPVLGSVDPTSSLEQGSAGASGPPAGSEYATLRNPFVYFHGITDSSSCAADDVGLDRLSADLKQAKQTPTLSYVVPDLCHDGRETPCAPGQPAGMPAADGFLRKVVPQILASPAYKQGGMLVITVDQAPSTGVFADSSSCCGQPRFPGLPASSTATGAGAGAGGGGGAVMLPASGGGQVGALVLSQFVKANTVSQPTYNHFGLLRTIEDLFGLKRLGYAGLAGVSSFDGTVFTAYKRQ